MPVKVTTVTTGSPGVARLVGIVFLLIGVGGLALAWHLTRQEQQFVAGAAEAPGVVEAVYKRVYQSNRINHSSALGNYTSDYVPWVRFRDAQGSSHLFEATSSASKPAPYAVGDAVTVVYNPTNPNKAQIKGFMGQHIGLVFAWGFAAVFTGLGLMCLLLLGRAKS